VVKIIPQESSGVEIGMKIAEKNDFIHHKEFFNKVKLLL
jgi:hypothetical protein